MALCQMLVDHCSLCQLLMFSCGQLMACPDVGVVFVDDRTQTDISDFPAIIALIIQNIELI